MLCCHCLKGLTRLHILDAQLSNRKGKRSIFSCKHKTGGTGWGGETGQQEISFHPKIRCPWCPDQTRRPGVGAVLPSSTSPPTLPRPAPLLTAFQPCSGPPRSHDHHPPTLGYRPPPQAHSWRPVPALPREQRRRSGRGALWAEGRGLGRWRLPASSTGGGFLPSRGRSPAPGTDTERWPSGS